MEIGTLCHFLDVLCGSFIFAKRLQIQSKSPLHNITLPRSWILEHLSHLDRLKDKDIRLGSAIITFVAELLELVYSGKSAGLYISMLPLSSQLLRRSSQSTSITKAKKFSRLAIVSGSWP